VETLQEAMLLSDEERTEMGQQGRMLIESKYTWEQTTQQMLDVYRWVLEGGKRPICLIQ